MSRPAAAPALVDSAAGAVEAVLLHAPAYEAAHFGAIYQGLLDALPPAARGVILAEAAALPDLEGVVAGLARPDRFAIVSAPEDARLTPWARDAAIAARAPDGEIVLLHADRLDRRDDLKAPALAAAALGARLEPAEAALEGGDVLIDGDTVLVGADTLHRLGGGDDAAGRRRFQDAIARVDGQDRRLVVIKSPFPVAAETERAITLQGEPWRETTGLFTAKDARQPIFHIDMFVTATGRRVGGRPVVLVGCPRLAAALLERVPHPAAGTEHFDAIAARLADAGRHVIRNPLPYIPMDDVAERRRVWFYAPTNNVLLQVDARAGDIVWLAAYGHDHWPELAAVDDAMLAIWRDLDFEPRVTPSGLLLAENLGGLHCFANVVRRAAPN